MGSRARVLLRSWMRGMADGGKVGDKVLPATSRDVVSSCSRQSPSQEFFTRGAGRGECGRPEDFLGANRESIPVSPAEIGVGAVWGRGGGGGCKVSMLMAMGRWSEFS